MKNKTILIVGCILMLSLIIAGCANNQPRNKTVPDGGDTITPTSGPTSTVTSTPESTSTVTSTPESTSTGTDMADEPATSNRTSVTQEELDQLMAGIESLESDDLGGLSSD